MGYRWTNCVVIGANIGFEPFEGERDDYDEFYEKYKSYLKAQDRGDIVYLEGNDYFIVGEILFLGDAASETIPFFEFDFEEKGYVEEKQRVKAYIKENNIVYNTLHDKGFPSIGCAPCTRAVQPGEDFRAGRWWWEDQSKKECGLHAAS